MPDDPRERFRRLINSEDDTQADQPSQPVPAAQPIPHQSYPALDKDNMPLPRQVTETDMDGTRVTPAAYDSTTHPRRRAAPVSRPAPTSYSYTGPNLRLSAGGSSSMRWARRLLVALIVLAFVLVGILLCLASVALYEYYSIASTLPPVSDLQQHSSQFETARILDRNGNVLYELIDPNEGRRTYVTLDKISPNLIAATLATEDKDYYNHPGYDPIAIMRAIWQNYTTGETVSGASTITQQIARSILLSPNERSQRTYLRKAREIMLAGEITRRYTKDQILELYLNEIYYGNLSYGVEAAAETYFHTTADQLTLGQAAFLAGLPQSPSVYDIYTNRDVTLARDQQVLSLMVKDSYDQNCIKVSNSPDPVCVDPVSAANAAVAMRDYTFPQPEFNIKYPHWVNYVRAQLENNYDPQTIYRSGFTVYTTLDPALQDAAQQLVTQQVAALAPNNTTDGALLAIRPSTGEILAMVGSADYNNEAISGQVNMATSETRQPGSAIKPINYVAAFEKGWTPATLIWDVPSEFPPSGDPNDPRDPYIPNNYDNKFHGPVTVRTALANSFNIPAVKTLQFVGVYGKGGMIEMAKRFGFTSLNRDDYGLSLTLGGGDVSLMEMVGAYAVFANNGARVPPVSILKIVDHNGKVVYEYHPPQAAQVVSPEHAYLITSILSDNQARSWMFGPNSVLNLPFPVAAKTGTTNDFRDNWTMGYTPDLVTGVWVGNADYSPMVNTTGVSGAAPIWSQFMQVAVPYVTQNNPTNFTRPGGIIEKTICALSGTEPSQWCKDGERTEIFAANQPPLPASKDLRRQVNIDTWTGLEASDACQGYTEKDTVINVTDPWARKWLKTGQGRDWLDSNGFSSPPVYAPSRECNGDDPRPTLNLSVHNGETITEPVLNLQGTIDAGDDVKSWVVEFGLGQDPNNWTTIAQGDQPARNTSFINWDLSNLPDRPVTIHMHAEGKNGFADKYIHFTLALPTPTPTITPFPTDTPEPPSTETPQPPAPPTEEPPTETPTP